MIWWRASGRAWGKKAEPRRKGADPSGWSTGLLLRHAELVSASMARHLLRLCVRFKGRPWPLNQVPGDEDDDASSSQMAQPTAFARPPVTSPLNRQIGRAHV